MMGITDESVGENFSPDLLQLARDKTLKVINEVASAIKPGMTENEAKEMIATVQTRLGATRTWHPPQVRFGVNTILPFGVPGRRDVVLQESDIYFLDISPVFDDHEGDVGRAFVIGDDPDFRRCCEDVKTIWSEVRDYWKSSGARGPELYAFAEKAAQTKGWLLSLKKANGHRIADFPHIARRRGSIQGFDGKLSPNRWILEVQIRHPSKSFGAFYEDLLNEGPDHE